MAILNFISIFKKSLAHPHVARNVMLKFQKKLTKQFFEFLAPQKNKNWSVADILNFSKKWTAHLHIVGNVIIKIWIISNF